MKLYWSYITSSLSELFCIYTVVKVVYIYFINLMLRNGRRPKAISLEANYRLVSP